VQEFNINGRTVTSNFDLVTQSFCCSRTSNKREDHAWNPLHLSESSGIGKRQHIIISNLTALDR